MNESLGIALVVLAALLVGAAIPVMVQLRGTLRTMEKGVAETMETIKRVDTIVAKVEREGRIEEIVDGMAAASKLVSQLRGSVRVASAIGAAVGPAIASAVNAFREDRDEAGSPSIETPRQVEPGVVQPEPRKQVMS